MAGKKAAKPKKLGVIEGWRVLEEYRDSVRERLTPEGIAERLTTLRELTVEIENEQRLIAEHKARMKPLLSQQKATLGEVMSGTYETEAMCTAYIDPEDKQVRTVRDDTGEVVEEREAMSWESQRRLDDDPDYDESDDGDEDAEAEGDD